MGALENYFIIMDSIVEMFKKMKVVGWPLAI
jgi:hypothetical protein